MNISRLSLLFFIVAGMAACSPSNDYLKVREDVMTLHDSVMMKNDRIVNQEMKIDTLLRNLGRLKSSKPNVDTADVRKNLSALQKELEMAEESMNEWMHRFQPDVEGKSNQEAVTYFTKEAEKIKKIDQLYDEKIKKADTYLSTISQ